MTVNDLEKNILHQFGCIYWLSLSSFQVEGNAHEVINITFLQEKKRQKESQLVVLVWKRLSNVK